MANLAELVHSKLDALTASLCASSLTQVSSQPQLGPDVHDPHPGSTAGYHHQLQALGGPDRTPVFPPTAPPSASQGVRVPSVEHSGSTSVPPPEAAPGASSHPSAAYDNCPPPPGFGVPPSQPSTLGWVLSDPPPSRSAPVHPQSRRIATPRVNFCRVTLRPLTWRTSYTRSVGSLVWLQTLRALHAAGLRPGSAS